MISTKKLVIVFFPQFLYGLLIALCFCILKGPGHFFNAELKM